MSYLLKSFTVPKDDVDKVYKRENAFVQVECISCFHNTATTIGTVMSTECEIRVESVPGRPKEKKEAVETFKYIVLKKSILLPPICRGIFTLNPGTAKPFLTVLFEPNLHPAYV